MSFPSSLPILRQTAHRRSCLRGDSSRHRMGIERFGLFPGLSPSPRNLRGTSQGGSFSKLLLPHYDLCTDPKLGPVSVPRTSPPPSKFSHLSSRHPGLSSVSFFPGFLIQGAAHRRHHAMDPFRFLRGGPPINVSSGFGFVALGYPGGFTLWQMLVNFSRRRPILQ